MGDRELGGVLPPTDDGKKCSLLKKAHTKLISTREWMPAFSRNRLCIALW
jgi:hypothetical protein